VLLIPPRIKSSSGVIFISQHRDGKMGHSSQKHSIAGWWLTYPSEKYWSLGMILPNIWKKNDPNHQPGIGSGILVNHLGLGHSSMIEA